MADIIINIAISKPSNKRLFIIDTSLFVRWRLCLGSVCTTFIAPLHHLLSKKICGSISKFFVGLDPDSRSPANHRRACLATITDVPRASVEPDADKAKRVEYRQTLANVSNGCMDEVKYTAERSTFGCKRTSAWGIGAGEQFTWWE